MKVKKDKNLNEFAEFITILYGNETLFKNNISFAELKDKKRNFLCLFVRTFIAIDEIKKVSLRNELNNFALS
jgi:hypothetical protein